MLKKVEKKSLKKSENIPSYKNFPKSEKVYVKGKIFKEIGGVKMSAYFIRTDTFSKKDDAIECIERKARIIIDENGEKIFDMDWL